MRDKSGVVASRYTLLLNCFAGLGALKQYGQTQLAAEMRVSAQIIRRRAADARHERCQRGMPVDQLKSLARIVVREIPPIRDSGHSSESLVAWMLGLDTLTTFDADVAKPLRAWWGITDPRAERSIKVKPASEKPAVEKTAKPKKTKAK